MQDDLDQKNSRVVRDALYQYTIEEIEGFTLRELEVLAEKKKVDERSLEDQTLEEERQVTFEAKAKALLIEEVKNCSDKRIAQNIRKSKSAFEVAAWVTVALQMSLKTSE